jgi:O-acetyl-ADP-ribose deacetylase (regulator of RNase III)
MMVLDHLPRYDTVVGSVAQDITSMDVDAIAVSANELLAMNLPGSVANAVLNTGGPEILAQAQAQAPTQVGNVVVTGAGRLRAKHVFHTVIQHVDAQGFLQHAHERDVRKALWTCFRKAHELRLRSLALPAMGVHAGGLSPEDAARMMIDVTHTYLLEFRPPLERVVFTLIDKMVALAFREAAIERGMLLV